ncbi:MAG: exodeoxyribonuclease V subunit gamma, partial [Propionibacteriaceae bacterium]|nr:exodeoxyribonuclease V subunit gamma [Propionibacteriaceae bacterium]
MLSTAHRAAARFQAPNIEALASQLVTRWAGPADAGDAIDPFAFDICVIPNLAMARWLSQFFATRQSVCAGIDFPTIGRFERDTLGEGITSWQPEKLVWQIRRGIYEDDSAELGELRAHLLTLRQPYTALAQIARNFARYAHYRPELVSQWRNGIDVDGSGNPHENAAWQAYLWRLIRLRTGGRDAVELYGEALAGLADSQPALGSTRIALFALPGISPLRQQFVSALGDFTQVDVFEITHDATTASSCPKAGDFVPKDSLLHQLQAPAAGTCPPPVAVDDDSVQFHLSHGLDRQVEVLRDVLGRLFMADPTLEPRDVAVLTPDVDLAAPLIDATFSDKVGRPTIGAAFRVQTAGRALARVNPFAEVLLRVLKLPDTRFTVSDFLDFAALAPISSKFRFDDAARLEKLIRRAEIKWGLDDTHLGRFGLEQFPQNTWVHGLQRLLLGVALSADDLAFAGRVFPVDDVDSSDVRTLGLLSELIGRINRLAHECESPCSTTEWGARCLTILTELTAPGVEDQDDLHWVTSQLSTLVDEGAGTQEVSRHEVVAVLEQRLSFSSLRARFSNGSLLVANLDDLRAVPHRVVCLLGWDASRYPHTVRSDGNDLLRMAPQPGDPDRAAADREALFDAVAAAREKLVVVCQGRSENTNLEVPLAAPLAGLQSRLRQLVEAGSADPQRLWRQINHQYPLQSFSPRNYLDDSWRSFDSDGYSGARVLAWSDTRQKTSTCAKTVDLAASGSPDKSTPIEVSLDDLISFYRDPAKYLLHNQAGISSDSAAKSEEIALTLDGLARHSLGEAALSWRKAGHSFEKIANALWRWGKLPPSRLGRAELQQTIENTAALESAVKGIWDKDLHKLALELHPAPVDAAGSGWHVIGQVLSLAHSVPVVGYSKMKDAQVLTSWVQLLALAASGS